MSLKIFIVGRRNYSDQLSRVLLIAGALGGALRTAVPLFKKYSEDVNDNDRSKNQYRK